MIRHFRFAPLAAAFLMATPAYGAPVGGRCAVVAKQPNGATKTVADPELHVIDETQAAGDFVYRRDPPAEAILCGRADIVPAANDYKVILAGFTLGLSAQSADGGNRVGVLEMSEGQLRFRMISGALSGDELQRLQIRLNEMQTAIRSR